MRKKDVMLSLVAVTSAPMAAYADASLTGNVTEAVNALKQDNGLTVTDGVIASPGAKVELPIGTFVKGKYTLTATTKENVTLSLKGIELGSDGSFELTAETEVVVVAECTDVNTNEGKFSVGGFSLTHVYDYQTEAATPLTSNLAAATAKLNDCDADDSRVEGLKVTSSVIAAKINVLNGEDDDALYNAYKEYKLYDGVDNSSLGNEIKTFAGDVDKQVAITTARDNALKAMTELNSQLDGVQATLNDVTNTTTKDTYQTQLDNIRTSIKNEIEAINKAYTNGDADEKYSESAIESTKSTISGNITTLETNINNADANDKAYSEVKPLIDAAKGKYNTAIETLRNKLTGKNAKGEDVYAKMFNDAQTELAEALTKLSTAENNNGTDNAHSNASATKETNKELVTEAECIIESVQKEYGDKHTALESAYSSAKNDYTTREADLKELTDKLEDAGLSGKYKEESTATEKLSAFKEKIETAYTNNNIDDLVANNVEGYNYNNERLAVDNAITALSTAATDDLANYDAWKDMTDEVKTLRDDLDAAKTLVHALKSDDEKYVVGERYSVTEKTISDAINAYEKAANEAKAAGTAVSVKNANASEQATIEGKIQTYSDNADNAVKNYDNFVTALTNAETALETLEKTVKNTSVTTADGSSTYAAEIAKIKEKIAGQKTKKDNALNTPDSKKNAHYNAVMGLSANDVEAITNQINNLNSSYSTDEKNYDASNLAISAKLLSEQAWNNINAINVTLNGNEDGTDKGLAGRIDEIPSDYPGATELTNALGALQNKLTEIENECPNFDTAAESEYVELMTSLNTVLNKLAELQNGGAEKVTPNIDGLSADVAAAEAVVNANDNNYKCATNDTETGLIDLVKKALGEAYETYTKSFGDPFYDEDKVTPSEKGEGAFTPAWQQLRGDLDKIKGNITASKKKYELLGDTWTEYQKTLTGYQETADALKKQATEEMANYNAYKEALDYFNGKNFDRAIGTTAVNDLKAAVNNLEQGSGYTYYRNILDGADNKNSYKAQATAIKDAIKASYEGYTAVDDKDDQKKLADNLLKNIQQLPKDAKDNEEAYEEQVAKGQTVLDYWSEVYTAISESDESSKKEDYLNQLIAIQGELLELNASVKSDWGQGKSVTNGASDKYDAIKVEIANLSQKQNDEYNDVIVDDNKARYNAFLAAATVAQNNYISAISTISALMNTVNPEYAEKVNDIVAANGGIYEYSGKIRTLKDNAWNTFGGDNAVPAGELWDAKEENKAEAIKYSTKITNELNKLIGKIYDAAKETLKSDCEAAKTKYDTAVSELQSQGYSDESIETAFKDVKTLIDNVKQEGVENVDDYTVKKEYAINADTWLTQLGDVDNMIATAKQDAAESEYTTRLSAKETQIAEERGKLEGFVNSGNLAKEDLDTYNTAVAETVGAAKAKKEASADLYADMPEIMTLLDDFDTKNPYTTLTKNAESDVANKNAYNEQVAQIKTLQDALNDLDAYARKYYVYYNATKTIAQVQRNIDNLTISVENAFGAGNAASNDITDNVTSIENLIDAARNMIDINEANALRAEILELRNTNAEVNAGDETAFKAMEERIDALEDGVSNANNQTEGKQDALIAMEKQIAALQTELETAKDANAASKVLGELNTAIGKVVTAYEAASTALEGSHQPVKDEYGTALTDIDATIKAIQTAIAECGSENSAIFYADKITKDIEVVAAEVDDITTKINDMEAPYAANDVAYERLNSEIEALRAEFNAVTSVIDGYRDEVKTSAMVTNDTATINQLLSNAQAAVDADYAAVKLTESSMVPGGSDIADKTAKLEKNAANMLAAYNINDQTTAVEAVKATIDESTYSSAMVIELNADYTNIVDAISEADLYRLDAYRSNVDFMDEAVPVINEKIAAISEAIEALKTKAEENSFVVGDANMDGKVLVDDYMIVLNATLGKVDIDENSTAFLAADVNGDESINIGDVSTMKKIVSGTYTSSKASYAKARRVATVATTEVSDAISLSSEGEGTKQRIAINLQNSRAYNACQMDVKLPAGVTLAGESLGSRADGLTLYSNDLDNGMHRIVLSSLDDVEIGEGAGAIIYLDVEVGYSYSGEGIEVSDVLFTDSAARLYSIGGVSGSETTGINTVTLGEAVKGKVYSVGGKLLKGLQRGVNIIRGDDGSTKKVIVK